MTEIAKMSRQELLDCISDKKKEIAQKLKNGETEQSFIIGGNSYTIKEWDKLLARFDKVVDDVKEEQSERREKQMQELYEKGSVKKYAFMEKLNGTYAGHVPYSYLARNGIIEYNGVIFCCDEKRNAICLGDMSNKKNVINVGILCIIELLKGMKNDEEKNRRSFTWRNCYWSRIRRVIRT